MSTNVQYFIYILYSLASLANAQANFYQTPLLELLDRTFDDLSRYCQKICPNPNWLLPKRSSKIFWKPTCASQKGYYQLLSV